MLIANQGGRREQYYFKYEDFVNRVGREMTFGSVCDCTYCYCDSELFPAFYGLLPALMYLLTTAPE